MNCRRSGLSETKTVSVAVLFATTLLSAGMARAADAPGLLGTIHRHVIQTTTVTDNGDLNPYAVVVAPVTAGKIQKDDVLVDNFNDLSNLQGRGTTIIHYNPTTKKTALFAKLPRNLAQCPGGVGLSTAMTMLKSGWVVVGSTPSADGTTNTKGNGCLLVLDCHRPARGGVGRPQHQRSVGQHGDRRQWLDRHVVRQHGRFRRSGSAGA